MKIAQHIIDNISRSTGLKLAIALDCSEQWIIKVLSANKFNGPLTTAAALKVIREETGLTDTDILVEEELTGTQN
jgi:hypothetical protein